MICCVYKVLGRLTFQVAVSGERMYMDAFTLQQVSQDCVDDFNFVAGMVPFLKDLITSVGSQNYRSRIMYQSYHARVSLCKFCIHTLPLTTIQYNIIQYNEIK